MHKVPAKPLTVQWQAPLRCPLQREPRPSKGFDPDRPKHVSVNLLQELTVRVENENHCGSNFLFIFL